MNKTENIVEYKKNYYREHRAHLLEIMLKPMTCDCGFTCAKTNLTRHQKTKLHLKKLKNKIL